MNIPAVIWHDNIEGKDVLDAAIRFADDLRKEHGGEPFVAQAGDAGGVLIAFVVIRWWPEENCGFVGLSWTAPEYRRKGVYRTLMEYVQIHVRAKGYRKIVCAVHGTNVASIATHTALGFKSTIVQMEMAI